MFDCKSLNLQLLAGVQLILGEPPHNIETIKHITTVAGVAGVLGNATEIEKKKKSLKDNQLKLKDFLENLDHARLWKSHLCTTIYKRLDKSGMFSFYLPSIYTSNGLYHISEMLYSLVAKGAESRSHFEDITFTSDELAVVLA